MCHYCPGAADCRRVRAVCGLSYVLRSQRADPSFYLRQFYSGDRGCNPGYIEQFVANSSRMTAVGAFGLIVTSLLLMYSIDSALNTIWRSTRSRPKVYSFAVYWMILTLGPLLAGASPAISSYLLSLRWASDRRRN